MPPDAVRAAGASPLTREVIVAAGVLDVIREHARRDAPNECCGLLLGGDARVDLAYPARNELASPTRFLVHPEDHFAALHEARALGLSVVGAYHSHPASPATPSPRDLLEAAYIDYVYLIVSLLEGNVRAFVLADGNFREVRIVPTT